MTYCKTKLMHLFGKHYILLICMPLHIFSRKEFINLLFFSSTRVQYSIFGTPLQVRCVLSWQRKSAQILDPLTSEGRQEWRLPAQTNTSSIIFMPSAPATITGNYAHWLFLLSCQKEELCVAMVKSRTHVECALPCKPESDQLWTAVPKEKNDLNIAAVPNELLEQIFRKLSPQSLK